MIVKVKLSKRYALRLLKTQNCKVKLFKGCEKEVVNENKTYTTRASDFDSESSVIWCYELGRYIDYENIKAIYHQATRFSLKKIFEEVNWE
jgi:hypothetical protein